jgi:hypothetical protein
MKIDFRKANVITGWIVCIIACTVYLMTREATVSFWDCGEFVPSAFKLEISHPPGAPLFILLGRLFIILQHSTPQNAAYHMNALASISSGLTIMFLFWTITHLARRMVEKRGEALTEGKKILILGAGVVGALSFTFSDSFWFSAVESIVFGVSPLFIAMAFWAILKWEEVADQPYADRWIILIAYIIGLSIGVHLLSILSIPAVVMTYYYRKFKPNVKKTILAFLIACALTGFVQIILIQDTVKLIGWFDLLFVNGLGLPFNSGSITCIVLIAAGITAGLIYAYRRKKYYLHLALLSLSFILIGYSTYFVILIRANAYPPIDMQNVTNPITLVSYLDRSQYGTWPILYGPDFTAQPTGTKVIGNIYKKDTATGRYEIVGQKLKAVYNSADEHLFPRVWDNDNSQGHVSFYQHELGLAKGEKPTFGDAVYFFFRDQLWWMYFRYLLWNYSGRQNDIQGIYPDNTRDGNWITGISFLDNWRLGDQSKMPESLKHNKAHNKLYMLPLLLGILGLIYQYKRSRHEFYVVFLLFFFTGIAIVIYLNQGLPQPRERDYSYVGSFYAFAIWIGLGVIGLYDFISKHAQPKAGYAALLSVACLGVPILMASQEWDDHDRSQKTLARDIAKDYLNSCAHNAILFTGGDNDTYPLWYAQEVENVRPDIRIIITTLLGTDWFIDDLRRKINESDPVPFSWSADKYQGDKRDYVYYYNPGNIPEDKYFNIEDVMQFLGSDNHADQLQMDNGQWINYLPTKHLYIPVDKKTVIANGTVPPEDTGYIVPEVKFTINNNVLMKNDLAELNIIAANHWKRPIYFTSPYLSLGLNDYLEIDGLTYRLVPYQKTDSAGLFGNLNVNIPFMYDNLMHKFAFGGAQTPGTYFDETNRRELQLIRSAFTQLAIALAIHHKKDSALQVLRYMDKNILPQNFPYGYTSPGNIHDLYSTQTAYAYYLAGDTTRAGQIVQDVMHDCEQQLNYYASLGSKLSSDLQQDEQSATYIIQQLQEMKHQFTVPAVPAAKDTAAGK